MNRRRFMGLFAAAGASTLGSSWLVERLMALEADGELPMTPGPGVESWLPTGCGMCPGGCGLEIRRIDGIPVGVRGLASHPVNEGRLCALPHGAIQLLFSPDRVRRPLKRAGRRGAGIWTEVSWEDAQGAIQQRLQELIAAGSRERVAFLDGRRTGVGRKVAEGFMAGVGSPHHVAPFEPSADKISQRMFGWQTAPGADLTRSRVVLMFDFDPFETDGSPVWQSRVYADARDRTIDRPIYIGVGPRLFGSLAKCDHWLCARPGTEGIVALAVANVIQRNGWENREFLRRETDWPESGSADGNALQQLVSDITPEIAAEIAHLPARQIEDVARRFVEHQPGVALVGPGTPTTPTTALTIAAVNLLNVLVGSVGRFGGIVEVPPPKFEPLWDVVSESLENERAAPVHSAAELTDMLHRNEPAPVDLLFLREANPVIDSPVGQTFRRALLSDDRMVVAFATELNDTTVMADLVLPEPTFLERWDILLAPPPFPRSQATLQQPAIPPMFSCRQSEEVLVQLCERLGDLSRVRFRGAGAEELTRIAARGLMKDPSGQVVPAVPGELVRDGADRDSFWKALKAGIGWGASELRAGSPRIHTLPGRLLDLPEEPSRTTLREWASPASVGLPDRYRYELVVFRTAQLRDGETANIPMMMELAGHWSATTWATWAEIHPRTAAQAGIGNGDLVRVVSERGHIEAVARVSEATPPGIVAVPLGFGHKQGSTAGGVGANVNDIAAISAQPLRPQGTRVNLVRV